MGNLRKALDLISRFERDRVFHAYVVRRIWYLLPVCVILLVLVFAVVAFVLMLGVQQFPEPSYRLLRLGMFLLACVAWILASTAVLYVLFSRLEKLAISAPRCDEQHPR
jgi:uncharacterized membrane protein